MNRRLSRDTVYVGRKFSVHVDRVALAGGGEQTREIVEHVGSSVLVPFDGASVLFVRQYRHAVGEAVLELPAGTLDEGEDAEAAARRELAEETGYSATALRHLGDYFPSPGYATEVMSFFLATGLTPGEAHPDEGEEIELVWIPAAEAVRIARAGEFRDLKTIAGLLMAGDRIL